VTEVSHRKYPLMSYFILHLHIKVDQINGLSQKYGKGTCTDKGGFFDVNLNFEL